MEREKQIIEEMAEEIEALFYCKGYEDNRGCYFANSCTSCKNANRENSIHIAEHLYNAGYRKERQGEWISVEDRLPENDTQVLGYNGEIHCYIVTESDFIKEKTWWLDNEGWNTAKGWGITHWMPLPQPPKMKGTE